jgi:hypothetical protein
LVYRQLNISHVDLWFIIPYLLFVVFLATRARALKSRVAELVDLAAQRAGLERIMRLNKKTKLESALTVQVPMDVIDSAPSARP